MINQERNKVSVKIYESTRDALEKVKMKVPARERPDYADMIEPAVESWLTSTGELSVKADVQNTGKLLSQKEARWVGVLTDILRSGHAV